jgi:hypothetical protein
MEFPRYKKEERGIHMSVKLFTFLGRRMHIEVLHLYLERALRENILDVYYMMDFSRTEEDALFIQEEYGRLFSVYGARIHLHHYGKNEWKSFYKSIDSFLEEDDIYIKCDDDILFIDIDGLKRAIEERKKDTRSFVIHSNCINNGVCAYYHRQHFPDFDLSLYPTGGILGTLFETPEIAYGIHAQFTDALLGGKEVASFYIPDVYFSSRISINFIMMRGSDRKWLGEVEADEYELSSFFPEMLLRPNRIIGDFVTSHYSYSLQDKIMFRNMALHTKYRQLAHLDLSSIQRLPSPRQQIDETDIPILLSEGLYLVRNWKKKKYLLCTEDVHYLNLSYEEECMKIDRQKSYFDIIPRKNGKYIIQLGIYYVVMANCMGSFHNDTILFYTMCNKQTAEWNFIPVLEGHTSYEEGDRFYILSPSFSYFLNRKEEKVILSKEKKTQWCIQQEEQEDYVEAVREIRNRKIYYTRENESPYTSFYRGWVSP